VLAQAPDPQSVKAARGLANPRTWSELGCTDTLVFGKCQGSGKQPYQVTVDLTEPAYRCTCPSRKFPCKHGLALLLLWVEHGEAVSTVSSDLAPETPVRPRVSGARSEAKVVDPEAQARRQAEREATMSAGLDEFERWLGDLVRQGLAGARRQPYSFWDETAARLVDTQLPSLAERVREVGGSLAGRSDWADVLLTEAGRWQLSIHAWRARDTLAPDLQGDLRVFLGWPRRQDEVARFSRVDDEWVVAGVRQGEDERILSQRTWMWGRRSRRWVVVLDFAAAGAALRTAHVVGSVVADAVVVHPGSDPPRVGLSGEQEVVGANAAPATLSVADAVDQLSTWLAANPWRDRMPVALADVVLVEDAGRWWLQDPAGDRLPLARLVEPWTMLALSAGHPATVVAEWDAGALVPISFLPPKPGAGSGFRGQERRAPVPL
jgi:hypothetical protein